jgi:hypothetical protein
LKSETTLKKHLEEKKRISEDQELHTLEFQQESYESLIRKLESDLRNHMKTLII